MRTWFTEKKKSWANKIKEEEEKKKKEEKKDEKKPDEEKKDGEKKEGDKKEVEEMKEEKKEEKKIVEEEEIVWTSSIEKKGGKTKDEIELSKIIEKIIEKAEFITKLAMPKQWDVDNARPILFKVNSNQADRTVQLSQESLAQNSIDYMAWLQSFAASQSSRGTVSNFESAKKEILSSSTSSVLSVL